jgi:hypothetical protein
MLLLFALCSANVRVSGEVLLDKNFRTPFNVPIRARMESVYVQIGENLGIMTK